MSVDVRCLVLDDEPDDVLLLRRALRAGGLDAEVTHIEALDELPGALLGTYDVLVTDYRLAGATALDALALVAVSRPDLPVIVVSGVIDEEQAGAAFRAGARDFVSKNRLERLGRAIQREVDAAAERRAAADLEARLTTSEARMSAVLSRLPGLVWELDAELRYRSSGGALLEPLFPRWRAMKGMCLLDVPGIPGDVVLAHQVALREQRGVSFDFTGGARIVACRVVPVVSSVGKLEGLVGFGFDVTEERVRERRTNELAAVVDALADAVLVIDADAVVSSANAAAGALLGVEPDALAGLPLRDLFREGDRLRVDEAVARALRNERVSGVEAVCAPAELPPSELELSLSPVAQRGMVIDGAVVVARDVGERKTLEAELRHAQKLEAVGRLAGGIAHDLNNVLLAVRGYASLLLDDLAGTPSADDVQEIDDAAARAASLVAGLLAFARRQVLVPKVLDAGAAVLKLAPLLRTAAGAGVEVALEVAPGLPSVSIDPIQLDQVVLNLVINARDAMGDRGRVTIVIGPAPGGVAISVADEGPGVPPEIAEDIFEPFFTTKGDEGAGLGLSIVSGIVSQSGGTIELESPPSGGATFRIWLPEVVHVPEWTESEGTGDGGDVGHVPAGRILVVDDDEAARSVVARLLGRLGWEVTPAPDAGAALALLDQGFSPDVLLTDLAMRGVDGYDLGALACERLPGLRVVFMTGAIDGAARTSLPAGTRVLGKPFGVEQLRAALAAA